MELVIYIKNINPKGYDQLQGTFPEFQDTAAPGFDRCPVVFSFDKVQRENWKKTIRMYR